MDAVQELVDRINALDCEFGKIQSEVELLTQQKDTIVKEAEECYTALYDILSRKEGSYFQVGSSVVIVNRNAHRDAANALTGHSLKVQPLTKI